MNPNPTDVTLYSGYDIAQSNMYLDKVCLAKRPDRCHCGHGTPDFMECELFLFSSGIGISAYS